MKVAVLATVVGYGGAEKVVLSLLENINPENFELIPVIFTRPSQINNKFFKHIKKITARYHEIFVNNYSFKYINPIVNLLETYKLLKHEKIDIIHTHGYRADIIGLFLSKTMGLPLISTCHGFISNDKSLKTYNLLDCILLRFFDKIITVSHGIKHDLIKYGIDGSTIAVIPNAVGTDYSNELSVRNRTKKRQALNIKTTDVIIGYIGRLSEEKGVKYLIEAAFILNGLKVPIRLLIIGDGPSQKELEALVKQKDIECNVIFAGFQSDIEKWIPAIDIFVLPSLTEGTPMALLEVMVLGVPVVASAVGGIPDVIESGQNGILVTPADPEEIADAVLRIYKNSEVRARLSKMAKQTIQYKFSIDQWAKKIESVYSEINPPQTL